MMPLFCSSSLRARVNVVLEMLLAHPVPFLQWSYLHRCCYPWSWTGLLHQLGILGKHGITIEKEARMHCRVNGRKQYLIFPVLC